MTKKEAVEEALLKIEQELSKRARNWKLIGNYHMETLVFLDDKNEHVMVDFHIDDEGTLIFHWEPRGFEALGYLYDTISVDNNQNN